MALASYSVRIIGNACIIQYDNGNGDSVSGILQTYYPRVDDGGKTQIKTYVTEVRPDIPYEITNGDGVA